MEYVNIQQTNDNKPCLIYKFFDKSLNKWLCKKILTTVNNSRLKIFQQEAETLEYISGFPLCLNYYGSKLKFIDNKYQLEIITEYCEKGDLSDHLLNRKKEQNYFKSKELFYHFSSFINLFSHLQSKNISHRDIKPENIFIVSDNEFKIGDFGSSTMNIDRKMFTIQGTECYLSPELREGYERFKYKTGGRCIEYNPFKSDVYSLGLVFLFMATLEIIDEMFCDLEDLDKLLKERLSMITNYKLRQIIFMMLNINSEQRPDFNELKVYFLNIIENKCCNKCLQLCISNYSFCKSCHSFYHTSCDSTFYCKECEESMICSCNHCKNQLDIINIKCLHTYCNNCKLYYIEAHNCHICIGFKILNEGFTLVDSLKLPLIFICLCGNRMNLSESKNYYQCNKCVRKYCSSCKGRYHPGTQCFIGDEYDLICKCGKGCTRKDLSTIFFFCEKCDFSRCVVCMSGLRSHRDCSVNYQEIKK
ncbi:hypothetical protein SteCoe_19895 [Stentor coeruleus]|uniref:Protein kinase domain-containing protein n=1 Tax=Stentor coeruleus TaxID=5963 RepID=A0A1R2BT98_9CILI|nr:hypothetical protein SteCoe_19895 [Stentor coeruleus]